MGRSGRASIMKGSGEASSRRPVELLLALYIHAMGLLILGVFSRSIVSKALRDLMGLGRREKNKRGSPAGPLISSAHGRCWRLEPSVCWPTRTAAPTRLAPG